MNGVSVTRTADGALAVGNLPPLFVELLLELPFLLAADPPEAVRRRLFPDPGADEAINAEWRRAQHPELFALLADAQAIVRDDLASLAPSKEMPWWTLEVPAAHVSAWISALNAGRLALGALHEVTQRDMEAELPDELDDRGMALLKIHAYAELQAALIEGPAP